MENRYLYRGKRKDNGEWVQGYLYGIWERRYILWGMTNDIPNMVEVDPTTICKCTGRFEEEHIYDYQDCMEVIGNNFDNPELLEKENRKDSCV